jgi:DNA polymerase
VPLVVTYHPAYLLRNPADKARAWDDLCLAAEVAGEESAGQSPR